MRKIKRLEKRLEEQEQRIIFLKAIFSEILTEKQKLKKLKFCSSLGIPREIRIEELLKENWY